MASSQAVRKKSAAIADGTPQLLQRIKEAVLILAGGAGLFLLLALLSHHPADPGWSHTGGNGPVQNQGGVVGAWLSDVLLYLFGRFAFVLPFMLAFGGWLIFRQRIERHDIDYYALGIRGAGFLLTLALGCGLDWAGRRGAAADTLHQAGGIVGDVVGRSAIDALGPTGGILMMLALFLTGLTLFTGLSWLWLMDTVGRITLEGIGWCRMRYGDLADYIASRRARRERVAVIKEEAEKRDSRPPPKIEPKIPDIVISDREDKEKQVVLFKEAPDTSLPPLSLLDAPAGGGPSHSREALEAMSRLVELKLRDFNVEVEVVAVHPGPVVTRFELQPAPGTKASKISGLSKDLARSLSTISVRVVEVIPGKSVIGLELPNQQREIVQLSEILKSREYDASASSLTLALGKDISGSPMVVDLQRMPHLLVAGTTGSGKSVALNAMILSLLYKSTPADVRMIMIDPKMLELSVYEGIPSLLTPVVTDMNDAANALRWSVGEMERRYRVMSALGVRNLAGYNRKVSEAEERGEPIADPFFEPTGMEGEEVPTLGNLPQIVVIVDELADMMMTTGKKVEQLIARLAQKARAAGIHLILATQRPSVDVITGLIKANIPSRIAFQVSSRVDSRTILDQQGAENLLGHGDMLYLPPGTSVPTRIHGAFVSDDEVHAVVARLKETGDPSYIDGITTGDGDDGDLAIPGMPAADDDAEKDELYDKACQIVIDTRRASISGVQRRLKIGYNRAARMLEQMEQAGLVSELQANGSREVLIPAREE